VTLHRPVEARAAALPGWVRAREANEWGFETIFLEDLANAARFARGFVLARAFLGETLARQVDDCGVEQYIRLQLARLDLEEWRPDEARSEFARAPLCGRPLQLAGAEGLSDLAHWQRSDEEARRVHEALTALRAGGLTTGERAELDQIEGRLLLMRGEAGARALLDHAIAIAEDLPSYDVPARKARSQSYAALIHDAGRRGAFGEALTLLAREVNAIAPARCALGLAIEYDQLTLAALDGSGAALGRHEPHRAAAARGTLAIPEDLIAALRSCDSIDVFARPPLQGRADLLPKEFAWRYRVSHAPAPLANHLPPRRLVVGGVDPPAQLELPPLGNFTPPAPGPKETLTVLEGPQATPARVLTEMENATAIEFHVHGLVDLGISDVSFLVLSPGAGGQYALTAAEVRHARLRGAPLVVLGACRTAASAPYLHEAWSLPMAFIDAGAHAVLASPAPLADSEAGPFFNDVQKRIRDGRAPAAALRDARVEWLARKPDSSVKDILLFE
jgi:hypothetical protein